MELLNCYYAHAAENTKFQRRCYWLLNSDEGVVLVHFLLVTAKAAAEAAAAAGNGSFGGRGPGPSVSHGVHGARPLVGSGGFGGGVQRVRSGGNLHENNAIDGWEHHQLAPNQYHYGNSGYEQTVRQNGTGPGFRRGSAAGGFGDTRAPPSVASLAAHELNRNDSDAWFSEVGFAGNIAGDNYQASLGPGDDAELDFFLRDASMDIGDGAGGGVGGNGELRRGESDNFGYGILRDFVHQEAMATNAAGGAGASMQRRISATLSLGGGDTELGVAVAAAAGVGGDGSGVARPAGVASLAAAAAGPDFGTSFPSATLPAHDRGPPRGPSRGGSWPNELRLVSSAELGGDGAAPGSTDELSPHVIPGSFEDGVRTMRDLEARVLELQQSLTVVAGVTSDEAKLQLARLENDMSALEHGHRAIANRQPPATLNPRGHRRRESGGDRRIPNRPVRWDDDVDLYDDEDSKDDADKEDDDGDDDDDEENLDGDDRGMGDDTLSSLAKAAAATRRPVSAVRDGGSQVGRALVRDRGVAPRGYAAGAPLPSGSEMDLTDMDEGDANGGGVPRSPSPAAAAAASRAAAAARDARGHRAHHRSPPVVPRNLTAGSIMWEIVDFSPEWDNESGGVKVIVSGSPRPGWPEGMHLCCVFGSVEVPAEQISPGTLRCRAPPHAPGRVPFYISCLGSGKRPVSDIRTFEYREAGAGSARDKRAAEVRLATGVTERDFQLRLVHLLIGADRSSVKHGSGSGGTGSGGRGSGGGGSGNGTGSGSNGGSGSGAGAGDDDVLSGDNAEGVVDAGSSPNRSSSLSGGGGGGDGNAAEIPSTAPPSLRQNTNPGASFVRKTLLSLALPGDPTGSSSENLSDEDVTRAFRTALDARLRWTISAEAKTRRLAMEGGGGVGVGAGGVGVGVAGGVAFATADHPPGFPHASSQVIPTPGFIVPRSAYDRVDAGGVGIIHCVAALGMNHAIGSLCKSGCDVNQLDRRRRTALHWAAAKGHEDTVAALLSSGANIRATARWGAGGYTAADLAVALGHGGIAAYISETSLAASLSNISLYGGPQGAAVRARFAKPNALGSGLTKTSAAGLLCGGGSGLGATRAGPTAGTHPRTTGVPPPHAARFQRGTRVNTTTHTPPKHHSLLLATETEVTATEDFDSRTDITDLETDHGGGRGLNHLGDETRRERDAAGMIQLAFRKHATRRRKLRKLRVGSGPPPVTAPGGVVPTLADTTIGGLVSVEEIGEVDVPSLKKEPPKPTGRVVANGEDSDAGSEPDEDVKRNVKKVVKKAEKAAMKITDSIRSLKTSNTRMGGGGSDDPGAYGKRGRDAGDAVRGFGAPVEDAPETASIDRSPSQEAIAEVERRIQTLQVRALLLQDSARSAGRASVSGAPRRRVPAGDIMRLVKVSGLAGSKNSAEALTEDLLSRPLKIGLASPGGSPSRPARKTRDSGGSAGSGGNGSIVEHATDDDDDDDDDDEGARIHKTEKIAKLRLNSFDRKSAVNSSKGDADVRRQRSRSDGDEDEEDAKLAVERIQAIIRSRRAREQYLRLRSVTMSLQERVAARARGEIPMGEDGDGDDIEVEDEEDDEAE